MDVKKGGIWRYIQRDAEGNEFAFNGVYHEVSSPEKLINTFEVEGFPGFVGLVTILFEGCLMARRNLPRPQFINQ